MNESIHILIVEDEAIIAEELKMMLMELGYTSITITHRYHDAIALMEEKKPDLVLLDIGLNYSENDGVDLGIYIKDCLQIPFIYITSNTDAATVARAKETEPAAYIPKPFNKEIIYANIEIALHKKQTQEIQKRIVVKHGSKNIMIEQQDIIFLKAENNYTEIHTTTNNAYVISN